MQRGTRGMDPIGLDGVAILVRASHQMRSFEDRFLTIGLPYRVIGGPRFYERAEIRDAIAYFRVICQPDDDLALERIVNTPRRGIGDSSLRQVRAAARGAETSLFQAARAVCQTDELPTRTRNALAGLVAACDRWRGLLRETGPRELAETVLDESGYTRMWQDDRSPDAPGRLDNLKELVKAVQEFDTLPAFLEHVSLVMDTAAEPEADLATIMTLHGAKGLEFDKVFLAGWEEGLFPSQRSIDEGGTKALEEERRLAYVGMTRARRRLTISFAANRRIYNQWSSSVPSRFIDELPAANIEHLHRNPATRPDLGTFLDDEPFVARPTSRFRSRRAEMNKVIEGRAEILHSRPVGRTGTIKQGDRVFHAKFGYGQVEGVEGNKLDIAFEKSGRKKVIDSFVEPA
jgi:DNA helicase-2/ATP-dependent DNA helicase PcrA